MKRSEAAGNAIDRGIGIGRIGAEKPTFDNNFDFSNYVESTN